MLSKANIFPLALLLFISATVNAQVKHRVLLTGEIGGDGVEVGSILIINEATNASTLTDKSGRFRIEAKAGDMILVASNFINGKRVAVTENDIKRKSIQIDVQPKVNELDEVEIKTVTAVSAGVLQQPAKTYTPAERNLETAGDFKPVHLLGILGGSLKVDPILNAISGRTKRLKKEVAVERKEALISKINDDPNYDEMFSKLNIPTHYKKAFIYYLAEDENFVATFIADNQPMINFLITTLAPKFLKTINE